MMPFAREFDDVYDIIKQAVESIDSGISAVRLDEVRAAGSITNDMVSEIEEATLCIADITGSNPNVMWEVGFAAALQKPTIAICQHEHEVPFDVKDVRNLRYSRGALSSTLRKPLEDAVKATLTRYTSSNSRVSSSNSKLHSLTIAVSGSSDTPPDKARFRIQRALGPYVQRGNSWLVGSVGTVDEVTVEYLLSQGEKSITVAGYSAYDISGKLLKIVEAEPTVKFIDASLEQMPRVADAPSNRDILFATRSDLIMIFWNGISQGTKQLINWVGSQGKDHYLGFVPPTYFERSGDALER